MTLFGVLRHLSANKMSDSESSTESYDGERRDSLAFFVKLQYYNFANILPSQFSSDMVKKEEMDPLLASFIPSVASFSPYFSEFTFSPKDVPDEEMPSAFLAMLNDLGMTYRWCITRSHLAKFTLLVQKGYRNLPYHNFRHAFSVAHFSYLTIKNYDLVTNGGLSELECFAFIIAALCHDLDHRGTNNSFQVTSQSVLAALYSSESSVMEHHHFSQAMHILNTEGCDILSNLIPEERQQFIEHMKHFILATDIARHFSILPDLDEMIEFTFNKHDPAHHKLAMSVLITSCDLSDQTKDWETAVSSADNVYKEFFAQGDLEKAMGKAPLEMMDRELAVIPSVQLRFIETVAKPVYNITRELFPQGIEPYRGIKANRKLWGELKKDYEHYKEKHHTQFYSLYDIIEAIKNSDDD